MPADNDVGERGDACSDPRRRHHDIDAAAQRLIHHTVPLDQALERGDRLVRRVALEVETEPEDFEKVREGLEALGAKIASAELTMTPSQTVPVSDDAEAGKLLRLMEALEDSDDAQQVYANFDIDSEKLERLSQAV